MPRNEARAGVIVVMNVLNLYRHVQVRDEHEHHATAIGLIFASGINCSCMHPVVKWTSVAPVVRRPAVAVPSASGQRASADAGQN